MIARAAAADLTSVNRADQGKYVALSFRDGAQRRARNSYSAALRFMDSGFAAGACTRTARSADPGGRAPE